MSYDQLIHDYEVGGEKLRNATKGLLLEDLLACPMPGTWSIQEIVIHLLDSDLVAVDRMKRIIAMDNPALPAFDQDAYVKHLYVADQSMEEAVALFDMNRRMFAKVLRKLPPAAFDRTGQHSEHGQQTLGEVLTYFTRHLDHHLKFLIDKREMLGNIMW